jgi:hypothetical protein
MGLEGARPRASFSGSSGTPAPRIVALSACSPRETVFEGFGDDARSLQQNYVGVAFHRKNDNTYEAVYLRPFNFRAADPIHKQHAVQYISLPKFDFQDLRDEFPEEFENPVDGSIVPTDWVKLRVGVEGSKVQIYVGTAREVTLEVRKLGQLDGGQVGLWVGNVSGGDFANLVITPTK